MIVTGKVAQVTIRPTVTFLNLDQPFPNSPFTVVMFPRPHSFYGDANALKGKTIEIKGKIKNYHDKPEIALDNTNQLTVFDSGMPIVFQVLGNQPTPRRLPSHQRRRPPSTQSTNFPEIM